jgi:hypothetical protein
VSTSTALPKSISLTYINDCVSAKNKEEGYKTRLEVRVDDKVFVFDVAMGNSLTVQIIYSLYDLCKNVARLVFRETPMFGLLYTFK